MMTFTLEDVYSSLYRSADTLPIGSFSKSIRFGEHKSNFRGEGHDFDKVAEYDPQIHSISQIDWRSMDLKGHVSVREFKLTKDFPVVVVGDLSASMMFGVDMQLKERMLLEAVGDTGLACFHAQDPMGFIGFAEDIIFNELPRTGEDNIYYLISRLYEFFEGLSIDGRGKLDRKKTDFYTAFDCLAKTYPNTSCFVLVISDFVGMDNLPDQKFLEEVTSQHEVVCVFLDDPQEFEAGGSAGYISQGNIETGQEESIAVRRMKEFGQHIRIERKKYRNSLQEIGIDSIVLQYGKHFERLYRFFLMRQDALKG